MELSIAGQIDNLYEIERCADIQELGLRTAQAKA
jgi:hypothetical protein